jgi:hypothetical protein
MKNCESVSRRAPLTGSGQPWSGNRPHYTRKRWRATDAAGLVRIVMSWLGKLHEAQAEIAARKADHPWKLRLERVRGKLDYDGFARISSQSILDLLEVPQNRRTAGTYRILARLMTELGWTAVRVRDMTRGGYLEQVRGYCRDTRQRSHPTASDQERAPASSQCAV